MLLALVWSLGGLRPNGPSPIHSAASSLIGASEYSEGATFQVSKGEDEGLV